MDEHALRPLVVAIAAALAGCAGAPQDPHGRTCDTTLPDLATAGHDADLGWACLPAAEGSCPRDPTPVDLLTSWVGVDPTDCSDEGAQVTCGPVRGADAGIREDDDCCYLLHRPDPGCVEGRPLRDPAGHIRQPHVDDPGDARAAHWVERALHEHASVAAFARAVLQLLALGAPAELVAAHVAAQADEVRHAEACFAAASRFAGHAIHAPALPLATSELPQGAEALLIDTVVGGCVGETLAAARAHEAAASVRDPVLRATLEAIADDETRHAALAWRTARWLLEARPHLRGVAQAALHPPGPLPDHPGDPDHGWLSGARVREVHAATWAAVIAPARRLLLGARPPEEVRA
ncbi:MAG: ferritin-like domain-containing protein [Alphaproteobacteria bacterium]|nr:ferritin-like domain-containing protein [Alphaproteobacteria bacterium]